MTLDFDTLEQHRSCTIRVFVRYDETAGIECVNCNEDIYQTENEITECKTDHEWIGSPTYCSACGVNQGEESN